MTKTLFPSAAFIGFDNILDQLDRLTAHATDSYPPHNIIKTSDNDYVIEVAVAGFYPNELNVTVDDRTLVITGNHESRERTFVHRGISTKKFTREFRLSEHVEINGAELKAGILSIYLKVVKPETKRPRNILIKHEDNNAKKIN